MATKRRRLPQGLLEFEGSLWDSERAERLLPRLCDLPEHNFSEKLASFNEAMADAKRAEEAAAEARNKARRIALRIWSIAKAEWSTKELQEATGYDDE